MKKQNKKNEKFCKENSIKTIATRIHRLGFVCVYTATEHWRNFRTKKDKKRNKKKQAETKLKDSKNKKSSTISFLDLDTEGRFGHSVHTKHMQPRNKSYPGLLFEFIAFFSTLLRKKKNVNKFE